MAEIFAAVALSVFAEGVSAGGVSTGATGGVVPVAVVGDEDALTFGVAETVEDASEDGTIFAESRRWYDRENPTASVNPTTIPIDATTNPPRL